MCTLSGEQTRPCGRGEPMSFSRISRASLVGAFIFAVAAFGAASTAVARPLGRSVAVPPGVALAVPTGGKATPIKATYTHNPPASPGVDLPPGNGDVMPSTTIYYVFWLPTGQHYESNAAGDTNYENLLIRWANDMGSSQFHNLVTQYYGN